MSAKSAMGSARGMVQSPPALPLLPGSSRVVSRYGNLPQDSEGD